MAVFILGPQAIFPSPDYSDPDGLLAVGGDLRPERLLAAYRMGIFPWYSDDQPMLWWSPDPRMVLYPDRFHLSKSLKKTIRRGTFQITMDTDFSSLIRNCAHIRLGNGQGTWITDEIIAAYTLLYQMGYAHSIEVWKDNQMVGGLYGVSLGRCFFGESMFSRENDASKVALFFLTRFCLFHRFIWIDCQVRTEHLTRMGAEEISRKRFLKELTKGLCYETRKGPWTSMDLGPPSQIPSIQPLPETGETHGNDCQFPGW
jgi:leucyl/phenylalanyl-tRNA--protein transferase